MTLGDSLFLPPRIFAPGPGEPTSLEAARVVVLPVPYDSTTDYRPGARDGPWAIIDASQNLELYDQELGQEVYHVGIHTLLELQPAMGGPQQMVERIYEVASRFLPRDVLPVMLGGEHTITLGMVQALLESYPRLSVLQLDAHTDLRDEYMGTRFGHACVMRRIGELCPVVAVGIRSLSLEEHQFAKEQGLPLFFAEALGGDASWVDRVVASLSPEVYVTIDLDVFDPSLMAAVGTPEPGGLRWEEVLTLLRAVARQRRVVGFDVVELSPKEGPVACAFTAAKLAYKFMGYIAFLPGGAPED